MAARRLELAREFELLCYAPKGWRAELRGRFPSEAAMREAAEGARRSGRFSLAEFYAHVLTREAGKAKPAHWYRHKLGSEGPLQGWADLRAEGEGGRHFPRPAAAEAEPEAEAEAEPEPEPEPEPEAALPA
jgi:hypothetical protein